MLIDTRHPLAQNAYVRDPFTRERIGTIFAVDTTTGEAHEYVREGNRVKTEPLDPTQASKFPRRLVKKITVRPWELRDRDTHELLAQSLRTK